MPQSRCGRVRSRCGGWWRRALGLIVVGAGVTVGRADGTPAGRYAAGLALQSTYEHFMQNVLYTRTGHDRMWGPEHDLARANIVATFENYGLVTMLDPFPWPYGTGHNVVAELPGTTRADEIYIVGAHYDSYAFNPPAPGADDNASGVAAVLTIAGVLAPWPSEATIRFIAFDREEWGLYGSRAYAEAHVHENLRAMINLDAISYHPSTGWPWAGVYGRPASKPLKDSVAQGVSYYGNLMILDGGRRDNSDHYWFEQLGFQAAWLREHHNNTLMHTPQDTIDTPNYVNYGYAVRFARGVTGWLVDHAGVTPDNPVGDLNCDYAVDHYDVDPFVLALANPAVYAARYPDCDPRTGDINGDGWVDFGDINPFIELLSGP